jgi:flagellar biosynthesis protein FliQ
MNKKILIGGAVSGVVVVVAIIVGLVVTSIGQALVFSITDTSTVLEAKELKTKHIQSFGLGLE